MSRSPLVAWRKLLAIGGAPAASHLVLSRAPSAERLFEPLAGARVMNADRLEALTKPLDIGGALSRVTAATADTRGADVPDTTIRRWRSEQLAEVAHDVRGTREPLVAPAPATRARHVHSFTKSETQTSRFVPGNAAPPSRSRTTEPAIPSTVRSKPSTRFAVVSAERYVPQSFTPAGLASAVTTARTTASLATSSGANTRVIVTSAVAEIDRLLTIASSTINATSSMSNTARPSRTETRTGYAESRDVSYLLADAVDRARAALTAGAATSPDEPRAIAQQSFTAPPEQLRSVNHAAATTEFAGGFRGLAQRTLIPAHSARRAPQRMEPEQNVSSDLTLDTLDSRVADSLVRVLEREARRHGIDLAEARA